MGRRHALSSIPMGRLTLGTVPVELLSWAGFFVPAFSSHLTYFICYLHDLGGQPVSALTWLAIKRKTGLAGDHPQNAGAIPHHSLRCPSEALPLRPPEGFLHFPVSSSTPCFCLPLLQLKVTCLPHTLIHTKVHTANPSLALFSLGGISFFTSIRALS